jgi:ATPase subunit of ABC transporter with duplicated ATPase domains
MKLEKVSDTTRTLKFEFEFADNGRGKPFELSLDQLSTGQRNLFALSTILHAAVGEDTTLCIDEPDNFTALNEIQPWLTALNDRVQDTGGQCFLISHHPEVINYLAAAHGLLFSREDLGPVRAKAFEWTKEETIAPAEVVARGWV